MYRFYEKLTKYGGGEVRNVFRNAFESQSAEGGLQKILWKLRGCPSIRLVREVRRKDKERERERERTGMRMG